MEDVQVMELKIIRIELLGEASAEIYERLHAYMENLGWKRQIFTNIAGASNTGPWQLPTAMYCGDTNLMCPEIADGLGKDIAAKIWTNPRVLVMGVGTNWSLWN
jgi:hypothetical protein